VAAACSPPAVDVVRVRAQLPALVHRQASADAAALSDSLTAAAQPSDSY